MPHCCVGSFPRKEGEILILACLDPSSQTVGSLFKAPWLIFNKILLIFIFVNAFLGMGKLKALCRHIPQELGWSTDVGMSRSMKPNSRILIQSPLSDFEIKFCYFFYICKCIFGDQCANCCVGSFPRREGGILLLACPAPSSQTVWSLFRAPWLIC